LRVKFAIMGTGNQVKDVFTNRSVLITGASGFLGKVLVEKLLYSVPEIKNVYLIIRPHKGHSPSDRLNKLLESPLYDRIRKRNPACLNKLIPIAGDLMEEGMGLSQSDTIQLCEDVSIVFHCAATVKFDEALRASVQMNLLGTQKLVALCHKMKKLVSLVHASTAYANCDRPHTDEIVYTPPVQPQQLVQAIEWMSDDMLEAITPQLLGKRPNTYTLTKALAETQILEDAKKLPLIIVRPSIIGAIWKEPLPGWTDNINGPTGIFAGVGKGVLTNMCGSKSSKADIIPVDIVSNMMIVAAAHRANTNYSQPPIIHCSSGELNPVKWGHILIYLQQFYMDYPLTECYRAPSTYFHTSRKLFMLNFYMKHYYPAQIIDFAARLTGNRPKFVRIYGKVWKMVETLHYFTTRGWSFDAKGLITLWDSLSEDDKKEFNFDIRQVNWDKYLFNYLMGMKIYLLKESLDDIPKARSNLAWLQRLSMYANAFVWAGLVRVFAWKRTQKQRWSIWLTGFLLTHVFQNWNLRPKIHFMTLDEYKKNALLY
jgi:fatty acyl-CoA reductase